MRVTYRNVHEHKARGRVRVSGGWCSGDGAGVNEIFAVDFLCLKLMGVAGHQDIAVELALPHGKRFCLTPWHDLCGW